MKRSIYATLLTAATLALGSCNEDDFTPLQMGAINIVNAVSGGTTVKMGTALRDSATVNTYRRWSFISGNTEFKVFPTNNPSTTYFNQTAQTQEGDWYSLFLTGTAASPEGMLIKENYTQHRDSVVAVRIVNLSPGSAPVNVTLATVADVNQFTGVAYKQVSDFKLIPAGRTATNAQFNFQVRNAEGTILANYLFTTANLTQSRFKNVTLVLRGTGGTGADAYGVIFVPGY